MCKRRRYVLKVEGAKTVTLSAEFSCYDWVYINVNFFKNNINK